MSDARGIFPDQSHIDRVRDALWVLHGGGASVMVGSGFSKHAQKARPDAGELPVLREVAREMADRLYPQSRGTERNGEDAGTGQLLNLAQEYETAFGRSDLHRFLKQQIRDEDFRPGDEHSRLLRLPWRDVFTTNWDTLLERARSHVPERAYTVVRDMDEIPLANQPRIVKLHGSLPAQFPLIFTEEDYRTYPAKFAPFVNTVQQAMMETVFCLIGFSGNDPNFLHWSGWVRDNLGAAAPKIYLAGWLDLSSHRRRMLENRGVVPIDLARHPKAHEWPEHLRHRYAIEWVLHTLEWGRPYDFTAWPSPQSQPNPEIPEHLEPVVEIASEQPRKEPDAGSQIVPSDLPEAVRRALQTWEHNRSLYPGWLLFPSGEEREKLRMRTNDWEGHILRSFPELAPVERLKAVRELVWRREILLEPISSELESAAEEVLKAVDCRNRTINEVTKSGIDWTSVRESWRIVALALLTPARFRFDRDLFDQRIEALKPFKNDHPDIAHHVMHERCLWEIYSMNFEALERLLEDWSVQDSDPVWMLRKAAMFWELDRNDEAAGLVRDALGAIRTSNTHVPNVANASREGWALWSALTMESLREIRKRWDELATVKCDAELEIDLIARQIHNTGESREAPIFDLGIRCSQGLHFSSFRPELAAYRAALLSEVAGLPPATNHNDFIGIAVASNMLQSAAEELATIHPELAIRLVLRVSNSETDSTLNRVLSRTRAAVLSSSSAVALSNICIDAINYALPRLVTVDGHWRRPFWTTRMRVALEVLSRLVLRVTPDVAEAIWDLSVQCYRSREVSRDHWLHDSVRNAIRRSWEALPQDRRTDDRVFDLLGAPIVGIDNFSATLSERYPDPGEFLQIEDLPTMRTSDNDDRWQEVVTYITRGLSNDGETRKRASRRILLVAFRGVLTETESSEIARALWSDKHTPADDMPGNTALQDWMFLLLPEPSPGLAEQRFRLKWLSSNMNLFQGNTERDGKTISVSLGVQPINPDRVEDVLWNVGAAISGLRERGRSLQLTDVECRYIVNIVKLWVDAHVPSLPVLYFPVEARQLTVWAIQGLASILPEVLISNSVGERLFGKLKKLTDSGTPGFELILGLVKTIPECFDDLLNWLRMGLVSHDQALASSAISGLRSWLMASVDTESSFRSPPDDLLREVGYMVASRRIPALPEALQLSKWVFDRGTPSQREIITSPALHGLNYLAKELKYDREHDEDYDLDLPLLRWRCAQLAQSMAQHGFKDEPTIDRWLKLGEVDPLPEVRYAVTTPTSL